MKQRTVGLTLIALIGLLGLSACRGGVDSPKPGAPLTGLEPVDSIELADSIGLAFNPDDHSLLLAGPGGLSRWEGGRWARLPVPGNPGLSAVAVNPDRPTTIYASGSGLGVIRSDDGGANWMEINSGLPQLDVTGLALHSTRRDTLFVWLKGLGTFRTEDAGEQWEKMPDQGPPDSDVRGLIHSDLPGSMNTGWLYAATPTGAYLSMDCF